MNKTDEWTLIGITEKEYETLSDHEYFCIHDDLYDIIKSNHQDRNILSGFISNDTNEDESHSEATDIHNDKIQNKKRTANNYSTNNNLQIRRQKIVDHRKNSIDDFRVMIVDPPSKLNSDE